DPREPDVPRPGWSPRARVERKQVIAAAADDDVALADGGRGDHPATGVVLPRERAGICIQRVHVPIEAADVETIAIECPRGVEGVARSERPDARARRWIERQDVAVAGAEIQV